ncbi:DUF6777 domain-containing protein, partial [Streptomyces sp. NPDC001795]|uniref:DUF6777 domain-containing protein n=1 Tax=Streptomyces sp. NPDC001795 TaxID=3154525 RepID=UPI003322BDA6
PWWKSAPRVALITALAVAGVALGLVLTRSGGGGGTPARGEVFLQAADKTGPDPFTESSATNSSAAPETPTPAGPTQSANVTRAVDGAAPGLYGGTRNSASCDTDKQIRALQADPAKNDAFASVLGIRPSAVPAYLRSLTPLRLRMDTRVTNHGYQNGKATSYQAILQAGTAVLVDGRGVPRVRCACGNPLTPPVAQKSTPKQTGDHWAGFRPQNVVVVDPAATVVDVFVLFDVDHNDWFDRHRGDHTGRHDQKTHPPVSATPSVSVSTPAPTTSPSPSPTSSSPTAPSSSPPPTSLSPSASTTPPPTESATTSQPTTSSAAGAPPTAQPTTSSAAGSPPTSASAGTTTQSASSLGTATGASELSVTTSGT